MQKVERKTVKTIFNGIAKAYLTLCYMLTFPLICCVLFSSLMAGDYGEEWDQRATAVITECKDVTRRSRGTRENGGPILSYKLTARYEVDGKEYQISTTCGTHYWVGEQVVISYNSQTPEDNYWSDDPIAENKRMKRLHTGSGILLILLIPGCLFGIAKSRKRKKKDLSLSGLRV